MKQLKFIFIIHTFLILLLQAQPSFEESWTKYYEANDNKILGIWPHNNRFTDISKLKELKYRWGFNNILLHVNYGIDKYNLVVNAGFDSLSIMRRIKQDTYMENVESIPETWAYFIDEPADLNENLTVWKSITDWIKNKYSDSKIVISGYKRDDFLKDYVNTIGDIAMFSSYKHWWEFLGFWISVPEDPDQRPDWSDMKNLFGNKFSLTWIGAHKDLSEYNGLLEKAHNLGLTGVFLYEPEPKDNEVDDNNLEQFSEAAVNHGFMKKYFQQVRDTYVGGVLQNRKLVGPPYLSNIPNEFDHSELRFQDYVVTNNRIEDYFAETKITAGSPYIFKIPASKNASLNSNHEIIMKPGFHAEYGSQFKAYIGNN